MSLFGDVRIVVTSHSVYQFALRFHEDSPTSQEDLYRLKGTIEREVRDALDHNRISAHKPSSLYPPDDPECLYAWTPAELRIYALKPNETCTLYAVMTTMRAER